MDKLLFAPKEKFRIIGSDAQCLWLEKDSERLSDAKSHADKEVAASNGYDSMSIYNDRGKRIYSVGLSMSIERSTHSIRS